MHPGTVRGIVGSVVGIMGGALGTYVGLKNATRPKRTRLDNPVGESTLALDRRYVGDWVIGPLPQESGGDLHDLPLLFRDPQDESLVNASACRRFSRGRRILVGPAEPVKLRLRASIISHIEATRSAFASANSLARSLSRPTPTDQRVRRATTRGTFRAAGS